MKKYRSPFLRILALYLILFPVSYLATASLAFVIPIKACLSVLLSPGFILLSLLAMTTGWGLHEMRRWSWYTFVVTIVASGYANAVLALDQGRGHQRAYWFAVMTIAWIIVLFRVSKELRVPYFLPRIHWWESNPRYKLSVPTEVDRVTHPEDEDLRGEILDISISGCFIKFRQDLEAHEHIQIRFKVFGVHVDLGGKVVWRTESAVTHPKGVGVKFSAMNRKQKKVMRAVMGRMKEISRLYRTSRFLMNEDEFFKKMRELQTAEIHLKKGDAS